METLPEAEQHESRDRTAELERDDAVDLASFDRDPSERDEPEQQGGRGDRERVYAGSSDVRRRIRSCSSTVPSPGSMSTTYAFGL